MNTSIPSTRKIVITGASGRLGSLVAKALIARAGDADQLTFSARAPEKIAALAAPGNEIVKADFDQPETLLIAFNGADTVLIISGDAPVDVRIRQHRNAIDAARKAGVKRVVYTSFVNPTAESQFTFARIHEDTEQYLKESGLQYSILRNNQYVANLSSGLAHSKETNQLAQPGAAGKVAFITHEDIAEAIAAVLLESGHEGRTYELTGPEALSLYDVADILSEARGAQVTVIEAEPAGFGEILQSVGLPPFMVEALLGIFAATKQNEYAAVSGDIERILGRKPQSVRDYIKSFA
ncbi:SDR family oxidoreductase [Hahella sp. KA22]|uniref:SDR family oxidoreductase n=1 Tax=Hahella sp. KA22 TaxID=1628392 RepID=UPI0013E31605|nr:SDR family oxidoreductase [Hahella sp. KA22]